VWLDALDEAIAFVRIYTSTAISKGHVRASGRR
jgi:hypothetical protein